MAELEDASLRATGISDPHQTAHLTQTTIKPRAVATPDQTRHEVDGVLPNPESRLNRLTQHHSYVCSESLKRHQIELKRESKLNSETSQSRRLARSQSEITTQPSDKRQSELWQTLRVEYEEQVHELLWPNPETDCLKDLLRAVTGCGRWDVLKLVTPSGRLVSPLSRLWPPPEHNPSTIYRLTRAAAHVCERDITTKKEDLLLLEDRLKSMETSLLDTSVPVPPSITDMRNNVSHLLQQLDRPDLIDWIGFKGFDWLILTVTSAYVVTPTTDNCGLLLRVHEEYISGRRPPPVVHSRCQDILKARYRPLDPAELNDTLQKFSLIREADVSQEVRQLLRLPTFDSWQWSQEEMLLLLQQMFVDLDLTTRCALDVTTLRRFLLRVFENYNVVPFHNFRHGFCVTQMMYAMVWACDMMHRIDPLDVFILLISCVCHDLDHPGYNNIYQINAGTDLALRYNDVSPLENHHCSVAFSILQEPSSNVLRGLSSAEQRRARDGIIRCILATDMARHNEIIEQFREVLPVFDFNVLEHRNLLSMILIKVADISNEARPVPVADPWIDCLLQEFYNQSDREKAEGLPVTPFMDRDKVNKAASQCSFITFVLLPLFSAAAELLQELEPLILQPAKEALAHYSRLNAARSSPHPPSEPARKESSDAAGRSDSLDLPNEPAASGVSGEEAPSLNEAEVSERSAKFKIATRTDSTIRRVSDDLDAVAAPPLPPSPRARSVDSNTQTMRISRYFRWLTMRPEERRTALPTGRSPRGTRSAPVVRQAPDTVNVTERCRPASSLHLSAFSNGKMPAGRESPSKSKPGYLRALVLPKRREHLLGCRKGNS